jgi:hypothetical protein
VARDSFPFVVTSCELFPVVMLKSKWQSTKGVRNRQTLLTYSHKIHFNTYDHDLKRNIFSKNMCIQIFSVLLNT